LDAAALADVIGGPSRPYVDEYLRVNLLLDSIAGEVATNITAEGFRAERIPASEVVDWEKLRGHLPHKLIGRYAGHGWIGRSILLVNKDYGAHVRYVTVLTDLPLEAASPVAGACGACVRCLSACPAEAIKKDPSQFNLKECFNQLQRFNDMLGEPHFICGLCVSVCKGKTARPYH
jgi:epoxyqueuosine reductase QueG